MYSIKFIQTTSLNVLAKGNPATVLLYVFLYLLHISHFLEHFVTQSINSLSQKSLLSLICVYIFSFDA